MAKGLEALNILYEYLRDEYDCRGMEKIDECKDVVEKELKAFKIIKENKIDSRLFTDGYFDDYHDYLGRMCTWNCCNNNKELFEKCWGILTEEEFDLLKEVLE